MAQLLALKRVKNFCRAGCFTFSTVAETWSQGEPNHGREPLEPLLSTRRVRRAADGLGTAFQPRNTRNARKKPGPEAVGCRGEKSFARNPRHISRDGGRKTERQGPTEAFSALRVPAGSREEDPAERGFMDYSASPRLCAGPKSACLVRPSREEIPRSS